MPAKRGKEYFTISVVSSMFDIHPQTLRLYEREGLLRPERSAGNTRLYSRQDIEHLSTILKKLREVQEEKQVLLAMREALETRLAASPSRHSTSV